MTSATRPLEPVPEPALARILGAIPFVEFLGVRFDRRGDEVWDGAHNADGALLDMDGLLLHRGGHRSRGLDRR